MDPTTRSGKITELKALVTSVRTALEQCADLMWEIQDEFQCDRRMLLAAAKRKTGRGQASNLLLCIRVRFDRPLAPPAADWKRIQARGHRVLHANATLAGKRRNLSPARRAASSINIFSNTISKNRKFGWRCQDLLRHAHVCEYDLVKTIEAKLRPVRMRVAELTSAGTRALQALYQHERMFKIEAEQGAFPSTPVDRTGTKKATPESPARGKFIPQLRVPNPHPQTVWLVPTHISDHAADDALETGLPPQLRRPV